MIVAGERKELMPNQGLPRSNQPLLAAGTLLLASLACRPVITIGWGEILLFSLVALLVFGPLLARIIRGVGRKRGQGTTRDEE
ncbi:MAG: hypothetical protein ACK2TT_08955 [Anaerolineales bacterium]|jgi:hypothetical protein